MKISKTFRVKKCEKIVPQYKLQFAHNYQLMMAISDDTDDGFEFFYSHFKYKLNVKLLCLHFIIKLLAQTNIYKKERIFIIERSRNFIKQYKPEGLMQEPNELRGTRIPHCVLSSFRSQITSNETS